MFTEDMQPRSMPRTGFGKDSVEVEGYVRGFSRRRPEVGISMLRLANIIGPGIRTSLTDYFSLPAIPVPFGFDARQVAAVWIGRPDGTPLPGATGRSLALPLLGRVFDLLPPAPRTVAPLPGRAAVAEAGPSLRLLFPPPDAVLQGDGPVLLRAMGGRRPLTFLVDGAPVPAPPAQRQASWQPGGPGFYAITVLDADGVSARVPVRVR